MRYLEKQILGCFIKDNTLLEETIIEPTHFKSESSKLLYQSMLTLHAQDKSIDHVTLISDNYEYIAQMGGPDFITGIETTGKVENFESYESEFIASYRKEESERIVKEWLSSDDDTQDLLQVLQKIEDIGHVDEYDKDEMLKSMYDMPYAEGVEDAGIKSGLNDLDAITGGFHNDSSYIVGARPSMGKTAFMLKIALSASEQGAVPLLFSLEMSQESLLRRLIATVGKINLFIARNPHKLSEAKKQAWQQAIKRLKNLKFEIYDKPMQTVQYMRSMIRKAQRKHEGKQLIVLIDYLTLINSTGTFHSDHAKFTDISARLKAIAEEYNCPVVTLAQLSRGVEQRNDKRPLLSDLRESGSIEQDADCVMFLYRDSYYNKENESETMEIIIAKHRDGPTGMAEVHYNKSTGVMGDLIVY